MRTWYKYDLDFMTSNGGVEYRPRYRTFEACSKDMEGYHSDNQSYATKHSFFARWFYGYHLNRLEHYDKFLRQHLERRDNILSIASGRCANELRLMEDGYSRITCSDMGIIDAYEPTKMLFSDFEFVKLDILEGSASTRFDAVITLSLIYLFDDDELKLYFKNVANSLTAGGRLVLDSAGSTDNLLSFLIHDCLLKWEVRVRQLLRYSRERKIYRFVVRQQGYRRTNDEIVRCAQAHGFKLLAQQSYAPLVEFQRSIIVNRIMKPGSVLEKLLSKIGESVPYIRMFYFKKIESSV